MKLKDIYKHLIYTLSDNGDWEYVREGIGSYNGQVFIVDLNDSGVNERDVLFVKDGMQVHEVLAAGKVTGVYEQSPSGKFYYNWECEGDKEAVSKFKTLVGL